MRRKFTEAAETGALGLYNAAALARSDYKPLESFDDLPASSENTENRTFAHEQSEITVFGKLLMKSGGAVALIGAGIELASDTDIGQLTVGTGLGAAAIGGLVYAYDKLSN